MHNEAERLQFYWLRHVLLSFDTLYFLTTDRMCGNAQRRLPLYNRHQNFLICYHGNMGWTGVNLNDSYLIG